MTWVREVLSQARRQPYMAAGGVLLVVSSFLSGYAGWAAVDAQRADRAEAVVDEAERCVTAWEVHAQVREAIPIPSEALIEVVTDADPAAVDAYRAAVARRIAETIHDPDCDLAEAQARLDQ